MRRRRGFILVLAMLLSLMVVVIGLAFLSIKRGEYAAGRAATGVTQARQLARAGADDARAKLARDEFFPTGIGDEQVLFSYTETLASLSDQSFEGLYKVTVDRRYRREGLLRVVSVGTAGTVDNPRGRYTVTLEIDLNDYTIKNWNEGQLPPL